MSGRWRGPESPPHSPPTAELERGRGERRGLRPAPQASEPPRSLALRSPFPGRIPELGTQPALAHRQPDGGAAALGETRAKPGPSAPASRALGSSVPTSPRAQPPPPALSVLRPPRCAPAPCPREAAPQPGRLLHVPFPQSPRKSNSERPAGLPRRRGPAERAWRGEGQSAAPGGCCPERAGTGSLRLQLPEPGDKRAGPHPSTPLYLARPATLRGRSVRTPSGRASRSHRCQPRRAAGVPLRPFASACDVPPPPTPLPPVSKVSQLFCLRIFRKVSARSPGVGLQCQARQPRGCPAPPSRGPLRSARPGRRAASSRSPSPERGARSASPPSRLP